VAVVGSLVSKLERDSTKGETTHKAIQKPRIHKTENKITKQKTNIKRILKHESRVTRKQQREANNNEARYCTEPTYSYINIIQ
jgi:hypothetical protein